MRCMRQAADYLYKQIIRDNMYINMKHLTKIKTKETKSFRCLYRFTLIYDPLLYVVILLMLSLITVLMV